MACHYNPHGNGPLTDYGRVLGATEISNRIFWDQDADDEIIAERSAFLMRPFEQNWLRPSMSYRGLYLIRNIGEDNQDDDFIHMNASVSLVGKFLERDKLTLVGQFGYAPKPRVLGPGERVEEYRAREYYAGYRLSRELGIYAGLMDKVFGIRVPDHIVFSRAITSLNQNDQTHGVVLQYSSSAIEIGLQPFVGNLVQDKDLRHQGITTMAELSLSDRVRVGGSLLRSSSSFVDQLMYSSHTLTESAESARIKTPENSAHLLVTSAKKWAGMRAFLGGNTGFESKRHRQGWDKEEESRAKKTVLKENNRKQRPDLIR